MLRMDQKQESYFKKAVDMVTKNFFLFFLFLASCACLKGMSNSINFLKDIFQNFNPISNTINIFDFVR